MANQFTKYDQIYQAMFQQIDKYFNLDFNSDMLVNSYYFPDIEKKVMANLEDDLSSDLYQVANRNFWLLVVSIFDYLDQNKIVYTFYNADIDSKQYKHALNLRSDLMQNYYDFIDAYGDISANNVLIDHDWNQLTLVNQNTSFYDLAKQIYKVLNYIHQRQTSKAGIKLSDSQSLIKILNFFNLEDYDLQNDELDIFLEK